MKIYKLPDLADTAPGGVFELGKDELKTDSIALRYCKLPPRASQHRVEAEPDRKVVLFVVSGCVNIRLKKTEFSMSAGEAMMLCATDEAVLDNPDENPAAYLIASSPVQSAAASAEAVKAERQVPEAPVGSAQAQTSAAVKDAIAGTAGQDETPDDSSFVITKEEYD